MPPRVILASSSPRRQELLSRCVERFDIVPPRGVDERAAGGPARERCVELARRKAMWALRRGRLPPGDVRVIGADTLVVLGGPDAPESVLGKPSGIDGARRTLGRLSGRSHRVVTGLAVARRRGSPRTAVAESVVSFRHLDERCIEDVLATGDWRDKAGGYGIQSEGGRLVDGVLGCYLNVVGLPVLLLADLLGDEVVPATGPDAASCECLDHPLYRGGGTCRDG